MTVKQFDRGWAKSLAPLIRVRVNISAQWLIGRSVRFLHSKSDYHDCCKQSSLHFKPSTVTTLTVEAVRGVGVKQSGGRLFQLNNLKRKIVDKLFYEWLSSFPLPSKQVTEPCLLSDF